LWLRLHAATVVRIRRRAPVEFPPGVYAYVGSARGPGGLEARIRRHRALDKPLHWHIDFLRPHCEWLGAWAFEDAGRGECDLAASLVATPGATLPIAGFGAADCRCAGHLVRFEAMPPVSRWPGARPVA
jgi:Uri superfamily endonuclease